jgi:uncharacterized protein (DUF433 family)
MNEPTDSYEWGGLIWRREGLVGGRPCIAGTGVSVRTIGRWYLLGATAEEIAADYPHLTLSQVFVALAYFFQHRGEVDVDDAEPPVPAQAEAMAA